MCKFVSFYIIGIAFSYNVVITESLFLWRIYKRKKCGPEIWAYFPGWFYDGHV